jgi:flagellar biosynthesis/type III secretory pathway protein FliH
MTPEQEARKTRWKEHRGTDRGDTRHRQHCFEAGYEAGLRARDEEIARLRGLLETVKAKLSQTVTDARAEIDRGLKGMP